MLGTSTAQHMQHKGLMLTFVDLSLADKQECIHDDLQEVVLCDQHPCLKQRDTINKEDDMYITYRSGEWAAFNSTQRGRN